MHTQIEREQDSTINRSEIMQKIGRIFLLVCLWLALIYFCTS